MPNHIHRAGSSLLIAGLLILASSAEASASPSVVGMTYDKAQEAVSSAGLSAEVSTVVGSELQQSDCVVVSQTVQAAKQFGREYTGSKVLLSLNCNEGLASPGKPGNSAASPAGRLLKKQQQAAAWRATPDGQEWCLNAEQEHPEWFPLDGCATS